MPRSNNTCSSRLPELWLNVALALVMLISSAHAGEQKATAQTDTATPIENPLLPRPKPSIHDVTDENPTILISVFRHQHAARDSLDHNALAPFSSRIGRSGFSRAAENIAYGHADFAVASHQSPRGEVDRRRTCPKWPPNLLGNGHRGKIKTVWPHLYADLRFRG